MTEEEFMESSLSSHTQTHMESEISSGATHPSNRTMDEAHIPPLESPVNFQSPTSPNDDMRNLVQMEIEDESNKSTMPQASFNYINSIIGSGVIGMPYALHQAGVFAGILLIIVVAFVTDYSLLLMVRGGQLSKSKTYQGMMEAAFGRPGFYILSLLQFIYPMIAMISYNIIVGDTLTKIFLYFSAFRSESLAAQRQLVVLAATLFVTLPLSLYRNISRLAKISLLSLFFIGIIMFIVIIRLFTMEINPPAEEQWTVVNFGGMVQAIGVFAFAFMCHHNVFMIYNSIQDTNESKWKQVTHVSVGSSMGVCLIFSIVGYATFTGYVQGDLLENYCRDDNLINFARFLFCLTILLTFPLECFVARDVVENICFPGKQPSPTNRHFSVTLLIVLAAFAASISTDCLGIVLELNGILAAMPLAYILPALCFLQLEPSSLKSRIKLPAIATAAFGFLVMISGLILIALNWQTRGCSHGEDMKYCTATSQSLVNTTSSSLTTFFNVTTSPATERLPLPVN